MALINFDSINKFTLLFLIVTCTVFSVESQNVPSAIPPALRIKISEYSRSSFYPKDGTSSDSAYVRSALLDSVIPSFLREFLVPGILAELAHEIFANITSETCQRDITYVWSTLMGSVLNSSLPDDFILHMVDSWGKPPSGILSGHLAVPGDFEECISARGRISGTEEKIRGSYCLGVFIPNLGSATGETKKQGKGQLSKNSRAALSPAELLELMVASTQTAFPPLVPYVGTCFPASCSMEDTDLFFANVFRIFTNNTITSSLLSCQQADKPPLGAGGYTMIVVLAIISCLCIIATFFDLMLPKILGETDPRNQSKVVKALKSFSVYTNTRKLLNTSTGSDNLGCLHGLRFFSMSWVVLGHTWENFLFQFPWNMVDVFRMYKYNWGMMAVLNGTVSVDTFFVLSGALVAYGILKELDKTKWLNVPLLYLHRYLRLTPTYAIIIGVLATLTPYFGNGPNWYFNDNHTKYCQKNWWHNILYINTLVTYNAGEGDATCHGESWYLANDMIYFILAPLFVYPLWRWKWFGLSLLGAWFLQSVIQTCVLIVKGSLMPTYIPFLPWDDYIPTIYYRPWTRSASYAVGIFLGYVLHNLKKNPRSVPRLPMWAVWLAWAACTGAAMAVVFGPYRYFDPVNISELGSPLSVMYGTLHRPLWAVVVAWIVFACVGGYGGPVNAFLSWKAFIPLGRLTYCIYLSSYHLQLIYAALNYHPVHYGIYSMIYIYLGHMTLFIMVGFVLTITVESPFMQLEKLLFEGVRKAPEKSNFVTNNNNVDENQNREETKTAA